jgi:hypothetical protein
MVTFLGSLSQFGTTYTNLGSEEIGSLRVLPKCYMQVMKCCRTLCLHRSENWLVRQLNDEPKPVYKVRFIREKGKATAKVLQWSPETSNSLLR